MEEAKFCVSHRETVSPRDKSVSGFGTGFATAWNRPNSVKSRLQSFSNRDWHRMCDSKGSARFAKSHRETVSRRDRLKAGSSQGGIVSPRDRLKAGSSQGGIVSRRDRLKVRSLKAGHIWQRCNMAAMQHGSDATWRLRNIKLSQFKLSCLDQAVPIQAVLS